MVPLSGENIRRIRTQLVGVVGLPTMSRGPESNSSRFIGVAVVLQVFEGVNCSGASARVRQALAALFQAKTGEPAGPENEGSDT